MRGTVLIGFAEALAGPESAWSLADAGWRVMAFTRAGGACPLRRSRVVTVVEVPPPEDDLAASVEGLRALLQSGVVDAVMPLDDQALLLCGRAVVSGAARLLGPPPAGIALALDKRLQLRAAREAGFLVPPTAEVSEDREAPLDELPFGPLVVRPALAALERDGRLVRPSGQPVAGVRAAREAIASLDGCGPLLVQPRIEGVGEGLFGIAAGGQIGSLSAHRRVRMLHPDGSGSSACRAAPVEPAVAEAAARMLAAAGWSGLFMVELLRDAEGRAWFVELNGRAWGSMALARRRGLEYPAWAAELALEAGAEPRLPQFDSQLVCRHLGRELLHLALVMRGPRQRPRSAWPSRKATARAVLGVRRNERFYNWRRDEPLVFVADTVRTLSAGLARLGA